MDNTTININRTEFLGQTKESIQACIDGDRYSQSKLYEQFAPKMFAVYMRYSKSREEAEDILQDGFVQVFKSLHTFRFAGSFEGWIRRIMVFVAIANYRTKPKMHAVVNNVENFSGLEVIDNTNEDVISMLGKKELLNIVQALPPTYRMVFNLYVFEGLKHREIAKELGITEGTSKSNFFDAKVILRKAIINLSL